MVPTSLGAEARLVLLVVLEEMALLVSGGAAEMVEEEGVGLTQQLEERVETVVSQVVAAAEAEALTRQTVETAELVGCQR